MKNNWKIRRLKEADCDKLIELVNKVQPHVPYTEERIRWQYFNCPHGQAVVWICEQNATIIGLAGHAPNKWYVNGMENILYHNVDAMTHPDFRLRGIHATLEEKTRENTLNSGALMSYVFPNDQSVRQIRKSDYIELTSVPMFVKYIDQGVQTVPTPPSYEIEEITCFGHEVDILQNSLSSLYPIFHKRDSDYLNWRFFEKPDDQYHAFYVLSAGKCVGYFVFKHFQRERETQQTHIIDFLVQPDDLKAGELILRQCMALAADAGVERLSCWMSHQNPWEKLFPKLGFNEEFVDRYLFIFLGNVVKLDESLSIPGNWYLTMGDSDVF